MSLASLAAVGGVTPDALSSDNVAFVLAPRLNAAGRMADPQLALDLLLTDDPARAEELCCRRSTNTTGSGRRPRPT